MVHSTYLLDLRRRASRELTFHPPHPEYHYHLDDIMAFAFSAKQAGQTFVEMFFNHLQQGAYVFFCGCLADIWQDYEKIFSISMKFCGEGHIIGTSV